MFYEFAIDPQAILKDSNVFQSIMKDFGITEGRLIAIFPKAWIKHIKEEIKTMPLSEMRMKALNSQIDKCCIKSKRDFDTNLRWLEAARKAHTSKPFHAILTDKNPYPDEDILCFSNILFEKTPKFNIPSDYRFIKTADNYQNATKLLFSISKEITFIDPYLKSSSFSPLEKMLENTTSASSINYLAEETAELRLNGKLEKLSKIIPENIELSLIFLNKDAFTLFTNEKIHDRFIITEKAGISFSYGLDEDKNATNIAYRLSEDTYLEIYKIYVDQLDDSFITKEIKIIGTKKL